jgi:ribosomal protein S18 acetylase RimI-like enzyme
MIRRSEDDIREFIDSITMRDTPEPGDERKVREIVESTDFFNDEEADIAVELVQERMSKGRQSGYYFLFAETPSEMAGYVCFGPIGGTESSFDLYWIVVHERYRGMGLGKKLIVLAERTIAGMGGLRVYADTSSREQYRPTRKFYIDAGYSLEAELNDFYAEGDGKSIFVKLLR